MTESNNAKANQKIQMHNPLTRSQSSLTNQESSTTSLLRGKKNRVRY